MRLNCKCSRSAGRRPTPLGCPRICGELAFTTIFRVVKLLVYQRFILLVNPRILEVACYVVVMVRTEKQMAAARLNGAKSKGPVTAMGKDRIRSNALKHGLTARLTLWRNEDTGQFQNLQLALLEQFQPANDVEFLCIEEMAMAKWRLRRVVGMETAAGNKHLEATRAEDGQGTLSAFTAAQQAGQLLTTLRQHEASYSRSYQRAYKHLRQLREGAVAATVGE